MSLSRPMRRSRPRVAAALAAAGALALLLSGCVGDAPTPSPSPSADAAEPIFASDEEALAAAVEAYELYQGASTTILAESGAHPERIDPFVTPAHSDLLAEEFGAFLAAGARTQGASTFDTTSLVDKSEADGLAQVSIYLCRDVSDVRIIGPDGSDVTPVDRDNRVPSQAFLVSNPEVPRTLLIDRIDEWSGDDFC
ncbi:hypothetical protein ESP57_13865 [Agromyces fucosus]|uniref:Uncharacterized protein n=1 Tax=Agromyces fucosus TaxID=41985 RepID=A0A4Q2JI12_9MICO|nr:hypothetical protein [Agromyces fucosus]RXZ47625.1 hypothetical protein ESP57_13865 [Agromyces fucosus]